MLKKMKRIVFYKSIVVLACAWCSAATAADTLPPLRDGQSPNDFEAMWAGFDPRAEPLETETLKEWEEDDVNLRIVRFRIGVFKGKKATLAAIYGFPKRVAGDDALRAASAQRNHPLLRGDSTESRVHSADLALGNTLPLFLPGA